MTNPSGGQISITSGSGMLQEFDFGDFGSKFDADEIWTINPTVTSDSFTTTRGSTNASYEIIDDKTLTISIDSKPSGGPEFVSGPADLTLILDFAIAGQLHVVSPPPQGNIELNYGQTSVFARLNGLGIWSGDWPPAGGIPDGVDPATWPRVNYTDTVAVGSGPYTVTLTTLGGVLRGTTFRSGGSATFTFVPEPGLCTMFGTAILVTIYRRASVQRH